MEGAAVRGVKSGKSKWTLPGLCLRLIGGFLPDVKERPGSDTVTVQLAASTAGFGVFCHV